MTRTTLFEVLAALSVACGQPAPPIAAEASQTDDAAGPLGAEDGAADNQVGEAISVAESDGGGSGLADAGIGSNTEAVDSGNNGLDATVPDPKPACAPINAVFPGSAVFGVAAVSDGGVAAINSGPVTQGVGAGVYLRTWDAAGKAVASAEILEVGIGRPRLVQPTAGGFVLAGVGKTLGPQKLWVVRTDLFGGESQSQFFGPDDKDWAGVVASRPDGYVFFASASDGGSAVSLIDSQGKQSFSKTIPDLFPRAVVSLADSKWLLWSRPPSGGVDDWTSEGGTLFVLGSDGALASQVAIAGPGGPGSSAMAVDGVGVWLARSLQANPEAYPYMRVDRVASSGGALWNWQHPSAPKSGDGPRYAYGIAALSNGDVVIAGMDDPVAGYLARLDGSGKAKWTKNFPKAVAAKGISGLTAVVAAPGGGIIIGGANMAGGWVARLDACGGLACGGTCGP